jgi:hypothetical protein
MRHAYLAVAVVLLVLGGPLGGALAQDRAEPKGSAAHIKAATGRVDGAAIRANARTSRD